MRPTLGPSLAHHDVGLGFGVTVEFDVRLIGPLVLRLAAREDQQLVFPLHDAQHLATVALVFDANPWTRPRP